MTLLKIDISAYFILALMVLTIPLDWVASVLFAASIHELCHCGAVFMMNGHISSITIRGDGAALEAYIPGNGSEMLCAAAGPVGSFLLLIFCHKVPKLAICGLIQGLANLMPVYPLDGARIMRCGLELAGFSDAEKILTYIRRIFCIFAAVLFVAMVKNFSSKRIVFFSLALWQLKGMWRKKPCKQRRIGVQ